MHLRDLGERLDRIVSGTPSISLSGIGVTGGEELFEVVACGCRIREDAAGWSVVDGPRRSWT